MIVRQLLEILNDVDLDTKVTFQGNVQGEDDQEGHFTFTTCTGHVLYAFERDGELVIGAAITDDF